MSSLVFRLNNIIDSIISVRSIVIDCNVLKLPTIAITGVLTDKVSQGLQLQDEYEYYFQYKGHIIEGIVSFDGATLPSSGSDITLSGYLTPRSLSMLRSNQVFRSIGEGISILTTGLSVPTTILPFENRGFYNQQGELNYSYMYDLALRVSPFMIPALSFNSLRYGIFKSEQQMQFKTNDLGGLISSETNIDSLDFKEVSEKIDTFSVETKSGHLYGTMGVGSNRQIVPKELIPEYNALSINLELISQVKPTVTLSIEDFCIGEVGDTILHNTKLGTPLKLLILGATYKISETGSSTVYKLYRL